MGPAMDFIRYVTAVYGDGREIIVINGAAFMEPHYIKSCAQRALDSGRLNDKAARMARNLV